MNKCDKCGFMHYRTDPCRAPKAIIEQLNAHLTELHSEVEGKPKRSGNRHRPGYFTEYMRGYRARQKAKNG